MPKGASLYAVVQVSGYRVYQEGLPKVSTSKVTEQYAGGFLYLITRLAAYPYSIMRATCRATYAIIPAMASPCALLNPIMRATYTLRGGIFLLRALRRFVGEVKAGIAFAFYKYMRSP